MIPCRPVATADTAIATRGLTRRFGRGRPALEDVSLMLASGAVVGVTGPNGSGKTTLLGILATLVAPSAGEASVFGCDVQREGGAVRRLVGLAPRSDTAHYGRLGARDNLRLFASLQGLAGAAARERIETLLERFGARAEGDRPLQACSTGMRQRFNLMRALVPTPRVLLLDEPLLGLDEAGARALVTLLESEWRGRPDRLVVAAAPQAGDLGLACDVEVPLVEGRLAR